MLYAENIGIHLSIDETALSNGELYTIVTNKAAQERKGSLVAMVKGTQADDIIEVLRKIPSRLRDNVKEVTLDMAANMNLIVKRCFIKADRVILHGSEIDKEFKETIYFLPVLFVNKNTGFV